MPLTRLQQDVVHVLAALRSEESHFAGGLVLNSSEDSPCFSHDFAIFHDAEAEVARDADTVPHIPVGVAFVDEHGAPGWIGNQPSLRIHPPTVRGCWPRVE